MRREESHDKLMLGKSRVTDRNTFEILQSTDQDTTWLPNPESIVILNQVTLIADCSKEKGKRIRQ